MVLTKDVTDQLLAALSVEEDKTSLNGQGGTLTMLLDGEKLVELARAKAQDSAGSRKVGDTEVGGVVQEMGVTFLRSEAARNFAIQHARKYCESPVVMQVGGHPTIVAGKTPNQPKAYRMQLPISLRPAGL